MNEKKHIHLGVYGMYFKNNRILVIKKGRGPYKNLYDLPGGRIEFGEKIEKCLKREILEETGLIVRKKTFFKLNEYKCSYEKEGVFKRFHHIGIYFIVDLSDGKIKKSPDGHDSKGARLILISRLNKKNTAPISYSILKDFLKSKKN